jgi:uncharacterized phage infection (PIP) family protein YhgE
MTRGIPKETDEKILEELKDMNKNIKELNDNIQKLYTPMEDSRKALDKICTDRRI